MNKIVDISTFFEDEFEGPAPVTYVAMLAMYGLYKQVLPIFIICLSLRFRGDSGTESHQ